MRLVLGNATILRGGELEPTEGFLVIREGLVEEVGEGKGPRGWIDLKRGIVSPTFTNAHVHLGDSIAQDYGAYRRIEERGGAGGGGGYEGGVGGGGAGGRGGVGGGGRGGRGPPPRGQGPPPGGRGP